MNTTYLEVIYDLKDVTAQEDSQPSTLHNQEFANEEYLKEGKSFPNYGTLEQDYFILDGSMPEFPDYPEDISFWSSQLSDANGNFNENPVLTILFTQNHTSIGLTLHFVGEIPVLIRIRWYDLKGNMISLKSYEPDTHDYFAKNMVENYGRIEIEFVQTLPYRYIKLGSIDYGTELIWGDNNIKKAILKENVIPYSEKLPGNDLSLQIVDEKNDFEIANPDGLHKVLQKDQKIMPYEYVNGERIFLGYYFLEDFTTEKKLVELKAKDFILMLENMEFKDGEVYNGELAGNVIEKIFDNTKIPFEVSEEVANEPIYGWLKIQTKRKALREILFACGAVADTSRKDRVQIYKPDRKVKATIGRNRKFSTTVKRDPYISEVGVKFSEYSANEEEKKLVKETIYPAGNNTIRFDKPVYDLRISTGSIVEAHTNYLIFNVEKETSVTIYGKQYEKQDMTVVASVPEIKAGENPGNVNFTGTLLNYKKAKEIATLLLEYYQLSLALEIRYLADREKPGTWIDAENANPTQGNYLAGIESIKTDLVGGYISTSQLRGYYKIVTDYAYTGDEIFTAESVGVL